MITPEQIAAWKALSEANEEDWDTDDRACPECHTPLCLAPDMEPRGLCADCRERLLEAVPALIAEVERLQGDEAVMKLSTMLGLGEPVRPDIHARTVRRLEVAAAENERLRGEVSDLHDKLRVVTEQNDALGDANVAHVENERLRAEIEKLKADHEACYVAAEEPAWGGPLDDKARAALRQSFPDVASIVRKALKELRYRHVERDALRAEVEQLKGKLARIADIVRPIRATNRSAAPHVVKMILDETFLEAASQPSASLLDFGPDGLYDDTRAVHLHGRCHAASDGDCNWRQCPQLKDYKTHCPLDKEIRDED